MLDARGDARDRAPLIEAFLTREGLVTGVALGGAILLAWAWVLFDMAPAEGMDAMPGMDAMSAAPFSAAYLASTFVMWMLMMVAMMLPSAAPMILFYARFASRSAMPRPGLASGLFAAVYVAIWAAFAALASLVQAVLVERGLASAMALTLGDRRLAGGLLIGAGLYQLSPLKRACLAACRSPLEFLMRCWRPGLAGALRLGLRHGLYCLGCCWALMLLLFVGGVMNLAWIAALAAVVLAEKYALAWMRPDRVIAALLIGGAAVLMLP